MKNKYWIKGGIIGVIILLGLPSIFICATIVYLYVKAGKADELSSLLDTGFSVFPGWYGVIPIIVCFALGAIVNIIWRNKHYLKASNVWFRSPKSTDAIWRRGLVVPCSFEGWVWSYLMIGTALSFVLNFGASATGILGFILAVLVGETVAIYKSKEDL